MIFFSFKEKDMIADIKMFLEEQILRKYLHMVNAEIC